MVRDACFAAPAPNYAAGTAAPLEHIPHLYFMDPVEGKEPDGKVVVPDFVVDIAAAFTRKRDMLAEHASQRVWLQQHHGVDNYLDEMERWSRARGAVAGREFGEGFRSYRGHAFPQNGLLEQVLTAEIVPINPGLTPR